ncbi:MBOAT family protein [Roseateles asaccharophilus]|uniref:Probable alginate O-acetylase AlgI n=1 Tax=Roseateles asaccharophilus TaxID=582607 RepID=A0ABU2ACZ9_9BURK|nr:MBOAT family protein [Roseateles asaccharophilus]MDR7335076.1 alginate O-acetyltransferase complex protein AlgI [Roseateles asaccharophilus]
MLFTTPAFVFVFLPLALLGFFLLCRWSNKAGIAWLLAASLLFYSHWEPRDTLLLCGSILVNFWLGLQISGRSSASRAWMIAGVTANLSLLALFKYGDFFTANLNRALGADLPLPGLTLPIGISFFTFTQIAFLVDAYQGKVREAQPLHYGLFVTYFPHLVAGPVLHHSQMMPQFAKPDIGRVQGAHLCAGLAIFAMGLAKKVVLADGISPYADLVFNAADQGAQPSLQECWLAMCAYTLQLYFDFSGYSDMAIGLSWMFNVSLPFNFNSPYRAANISEFWRRWHISLSTFLRDYLYIALGGNRHGPTRRYINLALTMILGGLWHGASWTFVAWGTLHGCYLMVHHGFRHLVGEPVLARLAGWRAWRFSAWLLTLLAVMVAWVLFRATSFAGAATILQGLVTTGGEAVHAIYWNAGRSVSTGALWCVALGALATLGPNTNVLGERLLAWCRAQPQKRLYLAGALAVVVPALVLVNATRDSVSAFIYFNF